MLWFWLLQNGTYKAQPVSNKDHFRDIKKQKIIRVLLLMTISWPHTFREEQTESFHEWSAEESICI